MMADPASGRCWLFYYPSLTSLLVLLRPVDKPNFNILDPQGPVPRKLRSQLAACKTLASGKKPEKEFFPVLRSSTLFIRVLHASSCKPPFCGELGAC